MRYITSGHARTYGPFFPLRGTPESWQIALSTRISTRVPLPVPRSVFFRSSLPMRFTAFLQSASLVLPILGAVSLNAQPTITYHPGHDTFVVGQTPGFRVDATGTGTLTYQWMRNGSDIPGATAARYYGPRVKSDDQGHSFSVRVTDGSGQSVVSNLATLNVATQTAHTVLPDPDPAQARFHLDAVNGSDQTGDGSASAPYRSLAFVRPLLTTGDLVIFHDGDYGSIELRYQPFPGWVTLMAAPGASPSIQKLVVDGGGHPNRVVWNGRFNMNYHLRVIGFDIRDGVSIGGANHVRVERCTIRRSPPLNGSVTAIQRAGVEIRACRSIVVADCEITESPSGIGARGNDLILRNNHIHHLSHDGISLTGCDQVLVDGNTIHNLDDGASDTNPPDWNRHCDGMHITMESGAYPIDANAGITIRGNTIYHCEAMGIMYQNWSTRLHFNSDFVVENNVFGPAGGYLLHFKDTCLGFVFRNNSVVTIQNDSYQGLYRNLTCSNYQIALPSYASSTGVEIYNNILPNITGDWVRPQYTTRFDHNLFYQKTSNFETGEHAVLSPTNPFLSNTSFSGEISESSMAINAGSPLNASHSDIRRITRDAQPDIGAWEFNSGNTPPSITSPGSRTVEAGSAVTIQIQVSDPDAGQTLDVHATGE